MDPADAPRLPRAFFEGHTVDVARALLGKVLVRREPEGLRAGRVVETEAYHGFDDRASHAHKGETPRTAPMFGHPGLAYVYQIYGVWWCLNAVTGSVGFPSAVLVRALAPLAPGDFGPRDAAGPGKLCRLLNIDRHLNRTDLVAGDALWFADDGRQVPPDRVASGARVGVDYAGAWAETPWRFWIAGDPSVSRLPPRRKAGG